MYICSTGECKAIRNNASLSVSNMVWNFWYGSDTALKQNWLEMMTDTIYHLPHNSMERREISSYIQSAVEAFCNWASRTGQAPNLNSSLNAFQILQNKFLRFILYIFREVQKE